MVDLKNLKFGIEFEFYGISSSKVLNLAELVINDKSLTANVRAAKTIVDSKKRQWKLKHDGSVNGEGHEFVTPPITLEDLPTVLELINKFKEAGATTNRSCGMHIHVDAKKHTSTSLMNLATYYLINENVIYDHFKVDDFRRSHYAKQMSRYYNNPVEKLKRVPKSADFNEFKMHIGSVLPKGWGLNMNSINYHKTIEFRLFNGTMDVKKVEESLLFALSLIAYTINNNDVDLSAKKNMDDILNDIGIKSKEIEVIAEVQAIESEIAESEIVA